MDTRKQMVKTDPMTTGIMGFALKGGAFIPYTLFPSWPGRRLDARPPEGWPSVSHCDITATPYMGIWADTEISIWA